MTLCYIPEQSALTFLSVLTSPSVNVIHDNCRMGHMPDGTRAAWVWLKAKLKR